jgi:hypothetical protein
MSSGIVERLSERMVRHLLSVGSRRYWRVLPVGIDWISCLAQGCRSLQEQLAPTIGSAGRRAGCGLALPAHPGLYTNSSNTRTR